MTSPPQEMVAKARAFAERFGIENHSHWVPDGTSVVTVIAGLAELLTSERERALAEVESCIVGIAAVVRVDANQHKDGSPKNLTLRASVIGLETAIDAIRSLKSPADAP